MPLPAAPNFADLSSGVLTKVEAELGKPGYEL